MCNELLIAVWGKESLRTDTGLFYVGVITYPCPEFHAGLVYLCHKKGPLWTIHIKTNYLGDNTKLLFNEKYQH